jgi:hypothetical protein
MQTDPAAETETPAPTLHEQRVLQITETYRAIADALAARGRTVPAEAVARPALSIRFFRRVRIVPGLRVNLSKRGASVSIGRCGAWYTVGPPGRRISVGVPGTGLFWVQQTPPARASREPSIFFVLVLTAIATALAIYVNAS